MMKRSLFGIALLLAVLVRYPQHGSASPVPSPLCFPTVPAITQCIDGRFREFWNDNGALPIFGYPITDQQSEVNRDTGHSYQTQWFERNRLELHPDNPRPYDVLLGRLGAELLARQGRGFEGIPAGVVIAGRCRMFTVADRQQAVCDPFLKYWEDHGLRFAGQIGTSYAESLALFGLPLTYPRMETNPNGDTVLTQWFERARFEYHGAAGVLLGLLGNETQGRTTIGPPALHDRLNGRWGNSLGTITIDFRTGVFTAVTGSTTIHKTLRLISENGSTVVLRLSDPDQSDVVTAQFLTEDRILVTAQRTGQSLTFDRLP
ncbi:MAG: hypothetical protein NVS2B7_18340 [Herpetosiphon sp.]